MSFAAKGSSPLMGEARRAWYFAVCSLCGMSLSPSLSHLGREGIWSELWGFGVTDGFLNNLQHTLKVVSNVRIPKSQHTKPLTGKKRITNFIIRVIQVLATVCFNNNFVFKTNKIKNVSSYRLLATVFNTKIFTTQVMPKRAFFWTHGFSEFASNICHRHSFYYGIVEGM
jgi:hypothetical protein